MNVAHLPSEPPRFTRACYRCDVTLVFEVLMLTIFTLLAQVVLTLRSAFFASDGFVLTRAEWNRIYAITSKNRIIALCFGVITISQFGLGLYITSDIAGRRCECD